MKKRIEINRDKLINEIIHIDIKHRLHYMQEIIYAILDIHSQKICSFQKSISYVNNNVPIPNNDSFTEDLTSFLENDIEMFDTYFNGIRSYTCVLMSQTIEVILRKIVWLRKEKSNKNRKTYFEMDYKDIKNEYNDLHVYSYDRLIEYNNISIIREINNSFKHNENKVLKKLADLSPDFVEGEEILLTNINIEIFLGATKAFCTKMAENRVRNILPQK
ncbi:MAG: hypothetical protein HQ591_08190 [candidate division Zixibacteria bacterium]|nr:hypothetical protein [Candidatus Tariuqbacter arcticus]